MISVIEKGNSYCRVAGEDWWLSKTEVIELLAPNDYKVDAYYLTDEEGKITDMYIYQGDMYIDRLENIGTFNTARAEQTEEDERIFVEQRKKISHFNKYAEDNAIGRVGIIERDTRPQITEVEEVIIPEPETRETQDYSLSEDYAARALQDL